MGNKVLRTRKIDSKYKANKPVKSHQIDEFCHHLLRPGLLKPEKIILKVFQAKQGHLLDLYKLNKRPSI